MATCPEPRVLRDPAFWRALAPGLHASENLLVGEPVAMAASEATRESLRAALRDEGYLHLPPQPLGMPLDAMARAIAAVEEAGLTAPFAFAFDEPWLLYWRLDGLLRTLLGDDYVRLPSFWAWRIDPQRGDTGWPPHRDRGPVSLRPDRSPKSLTVWVPLTDATPTNSCMYVLPADRDPVYAAESDDFFAHRPEDVRALPAAAGSVLCWTQALLHWGSTPSRRETRPRIALSCEFQRGDGPPFVAPATAPREIPGLEERLRLIARQVMHFRHMYIVEGEIEKLAALLLEA